MRYVVFQRMHVIYNDSAKVTSIFIISYIIVLFVENTKIFPVGTFEIIVFQHF